MFGMNGPPDQMLSKCLIPLKVHLANMKLYVWNEWSFWLLSDPLLVSENNSSNSTQPSPTIPFHVGLQIVIFCASSLVKRA